jgi:hypothetical protein
MRGRSIHQLGKSKFPKFIRNLSLLTTFAFLFLTPLYTSAIATNRSMERFHLSSKNFNEIPGIITEYSGSGRTLFSGHVLHELDGGHLAPLTILTNKPLIASSQVHNLWHYKQIVPSEFLSKGDEGIEQYFDLMNVTLVFAHENSWKRWFEERYERYKPVYDGDPFSGYIRLKARNSYFIEGDGSVTAQTNDEIVFTPTTTSGVLSFSWFPFLKASTCKLTPKDFGEEVTLIKFDECQPDKPVVIKSVSSINRIM